MNKLICIKVDRKLLKDANKIFKNIGMDLDTAISFYFKSVIRNKKIPFEYEIPNKATLRALKEAQDIKSGKKRAKAYKSVEELMQDLGI